jgi:hypothetical protein
MIETRLKKTGLKLHTPGKLSSLKWVNVHIRKDNAARPEKARPRKKNCVVRAHLKR